LAVAELVARPARVLVFGIGVAVAVLCFGLLSSETATSRLHATSVVRHNFRAAYDILVRPKGAATRFELAHHVVNDGFLSGLFGGITLKQWHEIEQTPGVSLAAPVADVGYFTLTDRIFVPFPPSVPHGSQTLYRVQTTWEVHDGLSNYPGGVFYLYWTDRPIHFDRLNSYYGTEKLPDGRSLEVCLELNNGATAGAPITNAGVGAAGNPFSPTDNFLLNTHLSCASAQVVVAHGVLHRLGIHGQAELAKEERSGLIGGEPSGTRGAIIDVSVPVLVAGIDPAAEEKLVGLRGAMTSGNYLKEGAGLSGWTSLPGTLSSERYRLLPLIASNQTYLDETAQLRISELEVPHGVDLASALSKPSAFDFATHLPGKVVGHASLTPDAAWQQELADFEAGSQVAFLSPGYWRVSPVHYKVLKGGLLAPQPVVNPPAVWQTAYVGDFAPPGSDDTQYRGLRLINELDWQVPDGRVQHVLSPREEVTGTFDPSRLRHFSPLSKVPLQTFFPPTVSAGSGQAARLLQGKALGPTSNVAGYLSQPPLMLTTIQGAFALENGDGEVLHLKNGRRGAAFMTRFSLSGSSNKIGVSPKAPISVVEVRVAGVTGPNRLSLARIKLVAERIARETGLTVNVTAGSSPYHQRIRLAAGHFGQPAMTVDQGWVRLDVDSRIIQSLSGQDTDLAVLVLLASVLFVGSATAVTVRGRRREMATLRTLGWPSGAVARLVVGECASVGVVAGLVGLGGVWAVARLWGLSVPASRLALVVPVALAVSVVGAAVPAWRTGAASPLRMLQPARNYGRWRPDVSSVPALAFANVTRLRGRSRVAVATLALAVAVLSVLVGVVLVFRGGVVNSLLGGVVALDVRGADMVSAGLVVAMGAVALADVRLGELRERAGELAVLAAVGWSPRRVARLAALESALLASVGALLGGVVGLVVLLGLGGALGVSVASAAGTTVAGVALTMATLAIPLRRQSRHSVAGVLAGE
jgi:hypothetical protein